jgi:hypothetical protein
VSASRLPTLAQGLPWVVPALWSSNDLIARLAHGAMPPGIWLDTRR